ncbi:helix-turn-helix transcriptional regulator [Pontibacillus salipaludis]|uniref:helix-turn-helix domain-containing protein n=1 Tax=Pontibacillus salipaludis TaxID=1697394 RepID=UPI0031F0DFF0
MYIAEKIRQLRIHKGMNQSEFVNGICSITYLSRIENGKIPPSKSFLSKISKKLDIDVEYLTTNDVTNFKSTILEIIKRYKSNNSLSEKELALLEIHATEAHPPDTLIEVYGVLLHYYVNKQELEKANKIYTNSLELLPNHIHSLYPDKSIYYYISCGSYLYYKQDFNGASKFYLKANQLLIDDESSLRANLYYNISLVQQRMNKKQDVSRSYAFKAHDIYIKLNQKQNIIAVLITIGVQYHLDALYEESKLYLEKAEQLVDQNAEEVIIGMIKYNYGRVYQGLGDYKKAIRSFEDSLQIHEGNDRERIYSLRGLIEVYTELKEWNQVNLHLLEAIEILQKCDMASVYIDIHSLAANLYKVRKDDFNYEKEMKNIIATSLDNKLYVKASKYSRQIGDHYHEVNAYKMAAKYYRMSLENQDKILEQEENHSK